jgi:hypothetical protein
MASIEEIKMIDAITMDIYFSGSAEDTPDIEMSVNNGPFYRSRKVSSMGSLSIKSGIFEKSKFRCELRQNVNVGDTLLIRTIGSNVVSKTFEFLRTSDGFILLDSYYAKIEKVEIEDANTINIYFSGYPNDIMSITSSFEILVNDTTECDIKWMQGKGKVDGLKKYKCRLKQKLNIGDTLLIRGKGGNIPNNIELEFYYSI